MRSAVIILAVAAVVLAEAPYHLPRPVPHAPPFGYPSGPAPPPPAPFPQLPQPRPAPQPFLPYHPVPAPSPGYHYQPPQPAPQPIPVYHPPAPIPQRIPIPHPQPIPNSYPQPHPVHYPQPQPLPVSYPRPQPIPIPQPSYGLPQPLPQPQPQPQPLPSYFYNAPQAPVAPLPAPNFPQIPSVAYQQPIFQPQFTAPFPLQSQALTNNAVTSYQADSNLYSTAQTQNNEVLDEAVVSRLQNIIRDSEHSSAKNAGYLSLVSGVSLENAKPSIEITSFVHNSPQNNAGLIDVRSASSAAQSSSSASAASFSSNYESPAVSTSSSQSNDSSASLRLLPNKPGNSYGVPI